MPSYLDHIGELESYGDMIDVGDGRQIRLKIEPDTDTTINHFDCYGKTSKIFDYYRERYSHRPDDMNGNAEKLQIGSGDWIWWQPPDPKETGAPKRGTAEFAKMRQQVSDLLEFGFCGVILEVLDGRDAYHLPIVTDTASLWAIDSLEHGYLTVLISDLIGELNIDG